MISNDERSELLRDASSLAYQAIKFSGLYWELMSAEWDGLAERLAKRLVFQLEEEIQSEIDTKEPTNVST